jgi:hypothetical protein
LPIHRFHLLPVTLQRLRLFRHLSSLSLWKTLRSSGCVNFVNRSNRKTFALQKYCAF